MLDANRANVRVLEEIGQRMKVEAGDALFVYYIGHASQDPKQKDADPEKGHYLDLHLPGRDGVKHVWLLDPGAKTLEVLRLDGERWIVAANYGDDDVVCAEPFEALEIPLTALWLPTPPPPQS